MNEDGKLSTLLMSALAIISVVFMRRLHMGWPFSCLLSPTLWTCLVDFPLAYPLKFALAFKGDFQAIFRAIFHSAVLLSRASKSLRQSHVQRGPIICPLWALQWPRARLGSTANGHIRGLSKEQADDTFHTQDAVLV
jgi:hypothetical protein